ncbi:MAG: sulfite exporter TauE/SafE family protein [Bacteroidia bacterium]
MTGQIIIALSLGLLGSFHCIGMCGPIALALPVHQKTLSARLLAIFTYNAGRVLTYSVFGVLFGLAGAGFAFFGIQQLLSIVLGSLVLIAVLFPRILGKLDIRKLLPFTNSLQSGVSRLFRKKTNGSFFTIGVLNGLLPCGMVYMALAGAMAGGSGIKGALFMAAFGLGTAPVMMLLPWFSSLVSIRFRSRLRITVPYFVSVMALLMILRGMNLGIPYLSPKMESNAQAINCHEIVKPCCHH